MWLADYHREIDRIFAKYDGITRLSWDGEKFDVVGSDPAILAAIMDDDLRELNETLHRNGLEGPKTWWRGK